MAPNVKQFPFVANPSQVMLHPVALVGGPTWWSYDQVLIGGLKCNGPKHEDGGEITVTHPAKSKIGYMGTLIPQSWACEEFGVTLEYEADKPDARFKFRLFYGCGDPSEIKLAESKLFEGQTDGKQRMRFKLNPEHIARRELLRVTLEVVRETPHPVFVYGAWLDVHL